MAGGEIGQRALQPAADQDSAVAEVLLVLVPSVLFRPTGNGQIPEIVMAFGGRPP